MRLRGIGGVAVYCRMAMAVFVIFSHSLVGAQASPADQPRPDALQKRPITVRDAIEMTRLAENPSFGTGQVVAFSPDGERFVVVLRKGVFENNTNQYSMLLWRKDGLARTSAPEILLQMSSSSNREAIRAVKWLDDNKTVLFLGEHVGETQQLYRIDTTTRRLRRVTSSQTNITAYSATPDGGTVAFVTQDNPANVFDNTTRREGLIITTQQLVNLVRGLGQSSSSLYIQAGALPARKIITKGQVPEEAPRLFISPNGRYVLVGTQVQGVPEIWREYKNDLFQQILRQQVPAKGHYSSLEEYELVDTITGKTRSLLDSPLGVEGSNVVWLNNSESAAISDLFLPLENVSGDELRARRAAPYAVEISVRSGDTSKITQEDVTLVGWDPSKQCLIFQSGRRRPKAGTEACFTKHANKWEEMGPVSQEEKLRVVPQENMNTPPRLVAIDPDTYVEHLLLDLNSQFRYLRLARVEELEWRNIDGSEVKGGLYYPLDYVSGHKYPLVIQTHGWTAEKFWIDGPYTTAFAAQPLAAKGIMVLQVDESWYDQDFNTRREWEKETGRIETAIDELDKRGLIDPQRLGIVGFSRTCFFVKSLLIHSKHQFAAASLAEGVDGGYFQYLQDITAIPSWTKLFYEGMNGGPPIGDGLKSWLSLSPGFNIDKVRTPIRDEATNPSTLVLEWEWFALLSRLNRPVELVCLQDGAHELDRPWDRIVSQQGNVDWFVFWLKGEEDPDPAKADQYVRWRELKKLQEQNETKPQAARAN